MNFIIIKGMDMFMIQVHFNYSFFFFLVKYDKIMLGEINGQIAYQKFQYYSAYRSW